MLPTTVSKLATRNGSPGGSNYRVLRASPPLHADLQPLHVRVETKSRSRYYAPVRNTTAKLQTERGDWRRRHASMQAERAVVILDPPSIVKERIGWGGGFKK